MRSAPSGAAGSSCLNTMLARSRCFRAPCTSPCTSLHSHSSRDTTPTGQNHRLDIVTKTLHESRAGCRIWLKSGIKKPFRDKCALFCIQSSPLTFDHGQCPLRQVEHPEEVVAQHSLSIPVIPRHFPGTLLWQSTVSCEEEKQDADFGGQSILAILSHPRRAIVSAGRGMRGSDAETSRTSPETFPCWRCSSGSHGSARWGVAGRGRWR